MPAMHLVSTDFPAPLSPQRPVTCPAGRSRSTSVSACTGPKCLSRPRTLSRGSSAACALGTASATLSAPFSRGSERTPVDHEGAGAVGAGTFHSSLDYEVGMLLAVQTLAPTLEHTDEADTKLSLNTVDAM